MWGYIKKISSLEEKASTQVAINLCQENDFKEVALCLEKPTYGGFISGHTPSFCDPEKLSIWAKVKDDEQLCDAFLRSLYLSQTEKTKQWDAAIDEQCQRLTEGIPLALPDRLRQKIHLWINHIALEYLSYSRRQEFLFGVSRYFLMNIFTAGDWKEGARLDERKLAQRLLEDEWLPVLQRYRIACIYCLHEHIPQLWERLTQEEKQSTIKCNLFQDKQDLVFMWSHHMNVNQVEKIAWQKKYLQAVVSQAISYGNRAALMVCWKEFQEDIRQKTVIDRALESLQLWQYMEEESCVKERLVLNHLALLPSPCPIQDYNLPSYYSELMFFFLLQMDEEQQLTFFKKAFQSKNCKSVLECFLEWPHQDDFLPMINRLWGIIPKDKYGQCLLALAGKYSGYDTNANCHYDYRSLLRALWEETPEEYKQYVFCNSIIDYSNLNKGKILFSRLLERSPFQERDEALFKLIFHDQPQEERRGMMLNKWGKNCTEGEKMCSLLIQKEKWSFLNGLLEECLSKEEIPDFKKRFIRSDCGVKLCLDALKKNRENLVEDFLDWSLESDAEKMQHKEKLFENEDCLYACESLFHAGKFADMERMINFCLSSDEKKERFKVHFAQYACGVLFDEYVADGCWSEDCIWEQMDPIIAWSLDTEEKIRDLKKGLFSLNDIDIHHRLVFVEREWAEVERFYQWFDLSPEEIKQLKRDTLFSAGVIENIYGNLPEYTNTLVDSLRWCLTDEEMVIDLKKEVEEYCTGVLDERKEMKKEQLDHLVSELLDGFRKEVQDKTDREGVFVKDTGEKRSSLGIEGESSSQRKRCK